MSRGAYCSRQLLVVQPLFSECFHPVLGRFGEGKLFPWCCLHPGAVQLLLQLLDAGRQRLGIISSEQIAPLGNLLHALQTVRGCLCDELIDTHTTLGIGHLFSPAD